MTEQEQRPPRFEPLTPEALAHLRESGRRAGEALALALKPLAEALRPLSDAVTAVYGPRVAARLEREAQLQADPGQRAELNRQAAAASAAASLAWRRLDAERRAAHRERGEGGE